MGLKYFDLLGDHRIVNSLTMSRNYSPIDTFDLEEACPRSKRKARMPRLANPHPSFQSIRSLGFLLVYLIQLFLLEKVPLVTSEESPRRQCMLALLQADENQDNLLTIDEFFIALSYLSKSPGCPPPHSADSGLDKLYEDPSLSAFVETFYNLSCLCPAGVPRTASSPLCCPTTRDENTALRMPTASDPDTYLDIFCWTMHSILNEQCEQGFLPRPTTEQNNLTDTQDPPAEPATTLPPTLSPTFQTPASPTYSTPVMQAIGAEVTTQPTPTPTFLPTESRTVPSVKDDNDGDNDEQTDQEPFISNDDLEVTSAPSMTPTLQQELQQEEKVGEEQSNSTFAATESSSSSNNAALEGNVDNGITLILSVALTVFCFFLCAATLYWRYRVRSSSSADAKKHHWSSNGTNNELPTRELSASVSNSTDSAAVEPGTDDKVKETVPGSVDQVWP